MEPILRSIDPRTNNLFKLIMYGSKGKMEMMYNMVSTLGQKLINGERAANKFGYGRTLAYFRRFDESPVSRGFIGDSFKNGLDACSYFFGAAAARFDLISKALSTSITGEQNRKSVKNLESIISDNFRRSTKHLTVIQLAYGEDYLDPRRVESVKFPTVMLSDAEFEQRYVDARFPAFTDKLRRDRQKYREVFFAVERMNVKEPFRDERKMPVHVSRVILNVVSATEKSETTKGSQSTSTTNSVKAADDSLANKVDAVIRFCKQLAFSTTNSAYIAAHNGKQRAPARNERAPARNERAPPHIYATCWLMRMLVRSHLYPKALEPLSSYQLNMILDSIWDRYTNALIDPGTAVGIIAAQAFSEPLTQYMLDAQHRSAVGGTSKSTIKRAKEVLGARPTNKMQVPSMLIPLRAGGDTSQVEAEKVASGIEMLCLQQFVNTWGVYYEKFGEPEHSATKHEREIIARYIQGTPNTPPPNDLLRWCVRFTINKTTLVLKHMSMDTIAIALRSNFPGVYTVYTGENDPDTIIRVYFRKTALKGIKNVTIDSVLALKDKMLQSIIRGINGIINAEATSLIRHHIAPDGSILRSQNLFGVMTTGTNITGVVNSDILGKRIDIYNIQTDAIQEMYELFGIEAARAKIISELRELVASCNHRHYLVYADEMTFTGEVTSIEAPGLKARDPNNILLRMGFKAPLNAMEEAAANHITTEIEGVSAPLMLGATPRVGTTYNDCVYNVDMLRGLVAEQREQVMDDFA
jgi:DNA-directed RNA polymerase II subunit RPB1